MSYLLIAIIAWIIYGFVSILEKFLLDKPIHSSTVFAFYTGVFSIFSIIIFVPFAHWSDWSHFIFDLSCGVIFLLGQYTLYKSLIRGDVSEMVPITGALVPIFTLIAANIILSLSLTPMQFTAFMLLVIGTVLISYRGHHFDKNAYWAVLSSLFLGIYYALVKIAYDPFTANYAFVRLGSFLAAMVMLFDPHVRDRLHAIGKGDNKQTSGLFVAKEVLAGSAFIILNYAIAKGNPALVNALQGIEYIVIFLLAVSITKFVPRILRENLKQEYILPKVFAILIIFIGLILLHK